MTVNANFNLKVGGNIMRFTSYAINDTTFGGFTNTEQQEVDMSYKITEN